MVAEPWLLKMGNQVSANLKHALLLETHNETGNKKNQNREIIGILSFEVANVMSKTVHLHKSLTDAAIGRLKNEILKSKGIKTLVSLDEVFLLELASAEKLDELNRIASVVSRLGKKCTVLLLQGFEHVYGDIVNGMINVKETGFLVKDMEGMVRKMERYVNSTASLYSEMEVLNELEQATKKFHQNQQEESRKAFEQKLVWKKQDMRHLKAVSLWNQTYDKVIELLARTVCTIYSRICLVFGESISRKKINSASVSEEQFGSGGILGHLMEDQMDAECNAKTPIRRVSRNNSGFHRSGKIEMGMVEKRRMNIRPRVGLQRAEVGFFPPEDFDFACGIGPRRLLMECLSLSSSASKVDDDDISYDDRCSQISHGCSAGNVVSKDQECCSCDFIGAQSDILCSEDQRQFKIGVANSERVGFKSKLMVCAPPSTVGGSALALHYANVIIIIQKLLRYPHLVGEEARDDLYQMLPTTLRKTLKISLQSYVKDLAIYDAPIAHNWKEKLDEILGWLAPLAHNMIRWQSEWNFEQHQIVKRTNVLLLETLYFANRVNTERIICELLVGLNYICRYEHQQNALLDCASSFDFDDFKEWQLQYSTSHNP